MKKKFIIVIVLHIYVMSVVGQTISPAESIEFCPSTNITFTVTLPRTSNNNIFISSVLNGPIVVSGPTDITHTTSQTTFKFIGKFQDVNNKQAFRVSYSVTGNPNASRDFQFKNVKSLYFPLNPSTSCSVIQLGQSSTTVPLCQVVNIPISFSNIKWSTFGESPAYCFGTITTYEYQLPNGWKIGATVSNGTNWIPGGNSVTVTSDLTNGHLGYIKVRPRNDCGTNLTSANGPDIVQLAIFRPGPTLTITGSNDNVCPSANFTINGMPSGATVQWTVSNTNAASPSCPTCATVTVNRVGAANTFVTLTATVTYCGNVYTKQKDISIGSPAPTGMNFQLIDPTFGKIRAVANAVPGATSYNWYINGVMNTANHSVSCTFGGLHDCDVYYDISVAAITACGTSSQYHQNAYMPCENNFMMSPNPASGSITVSTDQSKSASARKNNFTIDEVRIYDMQGNLKKYQKFNKVKSAAIDVSNLQAGAYFIEISNGTNKEQKQLLIQK